MPMMLLRVIPGKMVPIVTGVEMTSPFMKKKQSMMYVSERNSEKKKK